MDELFVPRTPAELRRLIGMTCTQPVDASDWLLDDMLARYYRGHETGMLELLHDLQASQTRQPAPAGCAASQRRGVERR